jgi:copper homeostasis protein
MTIEICAQSLQSALIAQQAGAQRIELCQALPLGGITPSYATLRHTREQLTIDIAVLIRPREGNFVYSELEMSVIRTDILLCKDLGMEAVVVGALTLDGALQLEQMKRMAEWAYPMEAVCHRAFDRLQVDPLEALSQLQNIGYQRILTSGLAENALAGVNMLAKLVAAAGDNIEIMPGGSITSSNVATILAQTKAQNVHLSAKKTIVDYWETDLAEVEKVVALLGN